MHKRVPKNRMDIIQALCYTEITIKKEMIP